MISILPKFQGLHAISLNFHVELHEYVKECEEEVIKHLIELLSDLVAVCPQTTINIFHQHFSNHDDAAVRDLSREMTLIMTNNNEMRELRRVSANGEQKSNVN